MVRDAVVPVVLVGIAAIVGWHITTIAYVVVGYAHFILGYWYRLRAHRESYQYLILAPLSVCAAFALYFEFWGSAAVLFAVTAPLFAAHFAFDEFFLHDENVRGWRWLSPIAFSLAFLFLNCALLFPSVYAYALTGALCMLLVLGVRLIVERSGISRAEQYLAYVGTLLFLLTGLGSPELIFGAVVLLHCYNWYHWGHYRALTHVGRVQSYWRDVGMTLGISTLVCILAVTGVVPEFTPLFSVENYYYVYFPVAMAHLATSLRFS